MIQLEDTLAQVRKEYEMLRIEFEQNLAANEQAGTFSLDGKGKPTLACRAFVRLYILLRDGLRLYGNKPARPFVSSLSGPINREMRHLISSLQNHNLQLKGDVQRYKRKLRETQMEINKVDVTHLFSFVVVFFIQPM